MGVLIQVLCGMGSGVALVGKCMGWFINGTGYFEA